MKSKGVSHHFRRRHNLHMSGMDQVLSNRLEIILATFLLLTITAWSYWPVMTSIFGKWRTDDNYSAGQLVPLVAVFLVWRERRTLRQCLLVPCWWAGIALLLLAQTARIYGLLFMSLAPGRYALVLAIAGLVLMVAGWQVFRRVVWILLFLFLMFPLPTRAHILISGPLQRFATTGAVFFLEAFGASVSQQGNIVTLKENTPIAVAEACSGLRMLTAFIIVTAFIAYMVKRARWQKAVLLISSIPIAVICNILRIFATAMLMLYVNEKLGLKFFHDFAGLIMMPASVMLLFGEIWLMDKIIVHESKHQQKSVVVSKKSAKSTHARP